MASVNLKEIEKDILKAISYLKKDHIRAYPKTIRSFLKGKVESPYYETYFKKHKDICGHYPYLNETLLDDCLNNLCKLGLLGKMPSKNGKFLYYIKEKTPKEDNNITINDRVLNKLMNKEKAKIYSFEYFNKLADWDSPTGHTENHVKVILPDGRVMHCDSKSEKKIVKYLIGKKLTVKIAGQNLQLTYDRPFSSNCKYFPDIVILTKEKHIAVIEVKPVTAMSYHINIDKYSCLKKYCNKHKFEYMMVDPDENYMTFEEMKNLEVPVEVTKRVIKHVKPNLGKVDKCILDQKDVTKLYKEFKDVYTKKKFALYIHTLIIKKGWYNKFEHGFMVFETPRR